MSLIIPCAGSSSRYPNMKPKWMLTSPTNNLMIQKCIENLDLENINEIYITFLKEHIDNYQFNDKLENLFQFTNKKINILLLDEKTKNQPETIIKTIYHFNIQGNIFIKDCDNNFDFKIKNDNYICSLEINEQNNVKKIYNKSFIEINESNHIINICEKNIISNKICIGGYSFNDSKLFIDLYNKVLCNKCNDNENLYISHLIYQGILENIIFKSYNVENYHDWGTSEDWIDYKNEFKTLFIDIDGTLFENSSEYFYPQWGESKPILENINHINKLYQKNRIQIILTTSRKLKYKQKTIDELKKYNISYDNIIFDLFHCKRFLINDYSNSNQYPTSISINLKRNNNDLKDFL